MMLINTTKEKIFEADVNRTPGEIEDLIPSI